MFSMFVFMCRDPGDTMSKVLCYAEPSSCFKNSVTKRLTHIITLWTQRCRCAIKAALDVQLQAVGLRFSASWYFHGKLFFISVQGNQRKGRGVVIRRRAICQE